MTNSELKNLRKYLFLEVSEAALWVANVSTRTWHRWEADTRRVPSAIEKRLQAIATDRKVILAMNNTPEKAARLHFDTLEKFAEAHGYECVIDWRLGQSIAAEVTTKHLGDLASKEKF